MSFPATNEAAASFAAQRSNILSAQLTDDGTPGGASNINGDYSSVSGMFFAQVPPGQVWYLTTSLFYISGNGNILANGYGPIGALANGIDLTFETSGGVPVTPPFPINIKTNGEFESYAFESRITDTGAGINHVVYQEQFAVTFGTPVVMEEGLRLVLRANDDLSGLTTHRVLLAGYWLSK